MPPTDDKSRHPKYRTYKLLLRQTTTNQTVK